MRDSWSGQPTGRQSALALPVHPVSLAPSSQRAEPVPFHLRSDGYASSRFRRVQTPLIALCTLALFGGSADGA